MYIDEKESIVVVKSIQDKINKFQLGNKVYNNEKDSIAVVKKYLG